MKENNQEINKYRLRQYSLDKDGNNGAFRVPYLGRYYLQIIVSDGLDWDHVSVSLPNRCPTWEEMSFIKDLFFDENETVVQFHPKKSEYVNNHPFCLHLWRKQEQEHELPPSIFTGIKTE